MQAQWNIKQHPFALQTTKKIHLTGAPVLLTKTEQGNYGQAISEAGFSSEKQFQTKLGGNMIVVLYTFDFEPITVVDLPLWLLDKAEKQGSIRVAVQNPHTPTEQPSEQDVMLVRAEKIRWLDGSTKTVLVTDQEELALRSYPEWLPGQRAAVNGMKKYIRALTNRLVKHIRKN